MDKKLELLRKIFQDKKKGENVEISDDEYEQLKDYLSILYDLGLCDWVYSELNKKPNFKKIQKKFNIKDIDLYLDEEHNICYKGTEDSNYSEYKKEIEKEYKAAIKYGIHWKLKCFQNGEIIINDIDKIFNGPLPVSFYLRK